jgi:Flp pilus assembly protein TadG
MRSKKSETCHERKGAAAIEFALVAPMLLILLGGVIEIGLGMFQAVQLQDAAEAGALFATKHGWDAAGISAAVANATNLDGVTATPAPLQFCGCPSSSGIAPSNCSTACANGNLASRYVTTGASAPRLSILPYMGLSLPSTLTFQSTIRLN